MISEKDRSQFTLKVFLTLLLTVLVIIYNSTHCSILSTVKEPHYKLSVLRLSDALKNETHKHKILIKPMPKGYLVWSDNCHMPSMDPFAPNYRNKGYPEIGPNCTEKSPLISKSYNESTKAYTLHINRNAKNQYLNGSITDDVDCCYKKILRNGDKRFKLLDCIKFKQNFIVPNDIDYMLIECRSTTNTSVFYEDGMHFIQERSSVNEKLDKNTQPRRKFGILLFGIDCVSQFNFRRVMPKTFEYFRNQSWFELSGYNKGTFLALTAWHRACKRTCLYLTLPHHFVLSKELKKCII